MTARASVRHHPDPHPVVPGVAADPCETHLERILVSDLDDTLIGTQVLLVGPDPAAGATTIALAGGVSDLVRLSPGDVLEIGCAVHSALVRVAVPCVALWVGGRMVVLDDGDTVLAALPPAAALAAP